MRSIDEILEDLRASQRRLDGIRADCNVVDIYFDEDNDFIDYKPDTVGEHYREWSRVLDDLKDYVESYYYNVHKIESEIKRLDDEFGYIMDDDTLDWYEREDREHSLKIKMDKQEDKLEKYKKKLEEIDELLDRSEFTNVWVRDGEGDIAFYGMFSRFVDQENYDRLKEWYNELESLRDELYELTY